MSKPKVTQPPALSSFPEVMQPAMQVVYDNYFEACAERERWSAERSAKLEAILVMARGANVPLIAADGTTV
jgi:hypothetical protein